MRDIFREENERARRDEIDAKQAQVEVLSATNPGEAITAAMGAAAGKKPYTGQTLGTAGNRLEAVDASKPPAQAVQAAAPAPVVPSAGAAIPTEGVAIPTGAPPAPAVNQNVIPETPVPVSAARPPVTPQLLQKHPPLLQDLPLLRPLSSPRCCSQPAPLSLTPALDKTDEQRLLSGPSAKPGLTRPTRRRPACRHRPGSRRSRQSNP